MLVEMAFTREQATKALKMTDNNMERAVEWIFSHPDDLGTDPEEDEQQPEVGGAAGGSGNNSKNEEILPAKSNLRKEYLSMKNGMAEI